MAEEEDSGAFNLLGKWGQVDPKEGDHSIAKKRALRLLHTSKQQTLV
jgi:hypothetical protein